MRRIVMFNQLSADGCYAGKDGGLDWVSPDDQLDEQAASGLARSDTLLFGRKTYQMFESFWPRAIEQPRAPDPHNPGRESRTIHDIGRWINDSHKIVFSRTLSEVTWKNSRLVREFHPGEIEQLKRGPGKDLMIFGSGEIVAQLLAHGLIDELMLSVSPVVVGSGRTMIAALEARARLQLLEAKPYPSGTVVLRYAPAR